MTASDTATPTFTRGDLVTVTYDDGTMQRTWHGAWDGLCDVVVNDRGEQAGSRRWQPVFLSGGSGIPDAQPWIRLGRPYNAAYDLGGAGLEMAGPDWLFQPTGDRMSIRLALPGVIVSAITDEGRVFLAENETLEGKRERLIDAFRALDADRAAALDTVIDELVGDAYLRGQQDASGY